MYKIKDIYEIINRFAPFSISEDWDNSGLLIGSKENLVNKIMLSLDIDESIIDEAIDKDVNLILTHHPIIFKPLKSITDSDPISRVIMKLIKNDISVISVHTNLDATKNGISDYMGRKIGLDNIINIGEETFKTVVKLGIHMPEIIVEEAINIIEKNGGGIIGDYKACTFFHNGISTFKEKDDRSEDYQKNDEIRLETFIEKGKVNSLINQIKKIHPYNYPTFEYHTVIMGQEGYSPIKFGELKNETELSEFLGFLKEEFKLDTLKYMKGSNNLVKKVAICPGSGMDLVKVAINSGADTYITSDIKYHEAKDVQSCGINLIDLGHFESEFFYLEIWKNILEEDLKVEIVISQNSKSPFHYLY
jgi:dinuclear metal center YbgI/SA1388 family protein